MKERYIVFDVETPNRANDRMSAIGITVVEDGKIRDSLYSLVYPEARFDYFNIQLTGISPEDVKDAPDFAALWQTIEPIFSSGILVAHNAPFDMGVLAKCLRAYGIRWKAQAYYACTCAMGKQCYPNLPNHKLNTMCEALGISLDHHRADSDSTACAKLLLDYQAQGFSVRPFIRTYRL